VLSIADWIIWMHRYVPSGFNWNLAWNDYKNGLRSSNLEDLAGMKTGAETEDFWLGRKDCSYDGDF